MSDVFAAEPFDEATAERLKGVLCDADAAVWACVDADPEAMADLLGVARDCLGWLGQVRKAAADGHLWALIERSTNRVHQEWLVSLAAFDADEHSHMMPQPEPPEPQPELFDATAAAEPWFYWHAVAADGRCALPDDEAAIAAAVLLDVDSWLIWIASAAVICYPCGNDSGLQYAHCAVNSAPVDEFVTAVRGGDADADCIRHTALTLKDRYDAYGPQWLIVADENTCEAAEDGNWDDTLLYARGLQNGRLEAQGLRSDKQVRRDVGLLGADLRNGDIAWGGHYGREHPAELDISPKITPKRVKASAAQTAAAMASAAAQKIYADRIWRWRGDAILWPSGDSWA